MTNAQTIDALFQQAVAAIDDGDVIALECLLAANPGLVRERLASPGPWLREKVGRALKGFFRKPYLLWFVAEDPVRNGKLPHNIAEVARTIIHASQRAGTVSPVDRFNDALRRTVQRWMPMHGHFSLQEQLDYALQLVAWSGVAAECGVQIELIDVLIDAGASPAGNPDNALVNGNFAAAAHLVQRGAPLTLATAVCLGRWDDVARLANAASDRERQFGFVLAALNGNAEALRRLIAIGIDVNRPSRNLYPHGTPLHHAVCSGNLEAVKVLVEAGADRTKKDRAWKGTPLNWAEHYLQEAGAGRADRQYAVIATYLRETGGSS